MDDYTLGKVITALADNEIKDHDLRQQVINRINNDRKLAFYYDVQLLISKNLKISIIKHPVPFSLREKLLKELESSKKD
jgi:chromosome condensin MukBEF ATPase and DNA-binding subunit MukB